MLFQALGEAIENARPRNALLMRRVFGAHEQGDAQRWGHVHSGPKNEPSFSVLWC